MSHRLTGVRGLLVCVVVGIVGWGGSSPNSGGSGTPSALSSRSCRNYMTAYTMTQTGSANPGFSATTTGTCTFTQAALQFNCMLRYSDTTGFSSTNTSISTYASIADIVDEVSVVPPLKRLISVSGTVVSGGSSTSSSGTYTYDSQKRITREVTTGSTTTYSAWDSAGRPTAASTIGSNGQTTTLTMSYNDTARTLTTSNTQSGITTSCNQVYDTNGNQISYVCTSSLPAAGTNGTTTVTGTAQVCK
jgi:YD repeat-containing protein